MVLSWNFQIMLVREDQLIKTQCIYTSSRTSLLLLPLLALLLILLLLLLLLLPFLLKTKPLLQLQLLVRLRAKRWKGCQKGTSIILLGRLTVIKIKLLRYHEEYIRLNKTQHVQAKSIINTTVPNDSTNARIPLLILLLPLLPLLLLWC